MINIKKSLIEENEVIIILLNNPKLIDRLDFYASLKQLIDNNKIICVISREEISITHNNQYVDEILSKINILKVDDNESELNAIRKMLKILSNSGKVMEDDTYTIVKLK